MGGDVEGGSGRARGGGVEREVGGRGEAGLSRIVIGVRRQLRCERQPAVGRASARSPKRGDRLRRASCSRWSARVAMLLLATCTGESHACTTIVPRSHSTPACLSKAASSALRSGRSCDAPWHSPWTCYRLSFALRTLPFPAGVVARPALLHHLVSWARRLPSLLRWLGGRKDV